MAAREKGGKVVFIGNIPYGVSEEQICDIFGRVGQVVNFRLVYDKETGRPKGFGFLEYTDVDAAASAVRNLNETEIMGRTLRVDYSNDNGGGGNRNNDQNQDSTRAPPPAHFSMNASAQPNGVDPAALPPLPDGTALPPGMTAPDAISQTMSAIPPPQLLDIVSQMKHMVHSEPQKATELLRASPQLSYAIFQALLLLGLVDTSVLGPLIQQIAPPTAAAPPPPQPIQQPPPIAYQQPPPAYAQPPYAAAPPPQLYQPPPHAYAPTPPVQQPAYQPPPPPPAAALAQADPQQQALIQQVLAMTREAIFAIAEPQRSSLIQLRAQLGAPVQ